MVQERKQSDDGTWRTVTHAYEVPEAGNLPSVPEAGLPQSVDLPVSLRDKDLEKKEERRVVCTACGEDFTDTDALAEHAMDACEVLNGGEAVDARAQLRKVGGRG